ncbi:MAG: folate-binding protein YgfZ [Alphaproteobacteria bacterium]
MFYTQLSGRGLLKISGSDALSFLQGLVTQDVRLLEKGQPAYAALLTPQGKYLHDFFLYPHNGAILLDGEKNRFADLAARLKLYKLRSDVTMEELPESLGVVASWGEQSSENLFKDPRMLELGYRLAGDVQKNLDWCKAQGYEQATYETYDAMRLELGVPDGSRDMIPEKSFMLECGMDKLHAISFDKGCYVGQEVTARSKFRGQVRKSLYVVRTDGALLPEPGTAITLDDREIGQMRSHNGRVGLAMLRMEIPETTHGPLMAGGILLHVSLPQWASQPEDAENAGV